MPSQPAADADRIAAAAPFETWYGSLQTMFPTTHPATKETARLVTNQENSDVPIHRWYNLKESFAASLPIWIHTWMREHYQHQPQQVCDPFLGSGSTGVALASLATTAVAGIEYNPFIRFVAATKANAAGICPQCFSEQIDHLAQATIANDTYPVPALTTLHNAAYSPPANIQYLLGMVHRIRSLPTDEMIKQALLLGVAATIDDAFHLHKDGRALRYRPKLMTTPLDQTLIARWQMMLHDICQFQQQHGQSHTPLYTVYRGSATNLQELHTLNGDQVAVPTHTFDTIIYSPPYLNNFDYSEVYKLELWMLGFIDSYDAWKSLRLGTLRSHHSISFPATHYLNSDSRTQHIAAWLALMVDSRCLPDAERMRISREILGYFDDMYLALCEQWRVLKPGGVLAYVVANSRHYYLPIATDVIIGEIARSMGFEALDLIVMRKRNGRTRQKQFLRESVAFFRKPNAKSTDSP